MPLLIALIAGVLAVAQPAANAQEPGDAPPSISEYPCPFDLFGERTVWCGEIEVPVDRDLPEGMTATVPFAVYESDSPNRQPDPIVYIDGGPGGSTLGALGSDAEFVFRGVIADRDLVLFDQRGTGYSAPSIRCPETVAAFTDQDLIEAMGECGDRLAGEGIDVSKFATDDVVLDLDALRRSLGYDQWNLFGISYGTTVALASARDVPDSARSIVLDSSYPQGLNTDQLVPNAASAFDVLAAGCQDQRSCRRNHAEIADGFIDLIADLNENPAMVPVYDDRNRQQLVPVTGTELAGFVFQLMYSVDALSWLPRLIAETGDGDYTLLSTALLFFGGGGPGGDPEEIDPAAFVQERYWATECNERYAFLTRSQMMTANEPHPDIWPSFYSSIDDDRTFSICEVFGPGSAPADENDQIFSDVPSLVLAGTYDPVTPPSWGEYAASGLSTSAFYELPASSHGVAPASECGSLIMLEFLNDPTGDDFGGGCESAEPGIDFQNSRAAGRVKIRNANFQAGPYLIRTKAPRNWVSIATDVRVRDNGPLDSSTGLIARALGTTTRKLALRQIRRDLPAGTKLINRGTRSTTAGVWEMFAAEVGPTAFDYAVIEIDGAWFAMLLVSELDERKRLRRVVLNQSLKRFKVRMAPTEPQIVATASSATSIVSDGSAFAELWADVQRVSGSVVQTQVGSR